MARGIRRTDLHTCPGGSSKERDAFRKWLDANDGRGCWGLYLHAVATKKDRLRAGMKKVRINNPGKITPSGFPERIKRRYYEFRYHQGRCSFDAWWKWQQGGPHPLNYL